MLTGVTREVEFEAVVACEHCNGNGAEPGTPIVTCETCGGAGQVRQVSRTPFGQVMRTGNCPTCARRRQDRRDALRGLPWRGPQGSQKGWEVEIPAGIDHGQRIRITGAGHEGEVGGRCGDLYVQVEVEPRRATSTARAVIWSPSPRSR